MIELSEHKEIWIQPNSEAENPGAVFLDLEDYALLEKQSSKPFPFDPNRNCFTLKPFQTGEGKHLYTLRADYYVGLDWLIEGRLPLYVEPKMNSALTSYFEEVMEEDEEDRGKSSKEEIEEESIGKGQIKEIDYLKMLLQVLSVERCAQKAKKLVFIDWGARTIPITSTKYDQLTPFLIVQFLRLLKTIVRKGLRKSYYKIQRNLNNQVKGKVLVGAHIKKNVFKNRLTTTYCEYEEFGVDSTENRFLKKVLSFVSSFVENHHTLFRDNLDDVLQLIRFCRPAFQKVGSHLKEYELKNLRFNPFFKEYKDALNIGQHILKRFSYSLTKTTEDKTEIPPFWIDMPQLFELYFYYKLLQSNPESESKIYFQFSTYGNALDFLITEKECEMIIDTKYKPYYNKGRIHEDIRQVSGYARLNKVRNRLGLEHSDKIIDCLIVYPKIGGDIRKEVYELPKLKEALVENNQIKMYHRIYKLGIDLPLIENPIE